MLMYGRDLPERRKSQCPECFAARGDVFIGVTDIGAASVSYRCPACEATWRVRQTLRTSADRVWLRT